MTDILTYPLFKECTMLYQRIRIGIMLTISIFLCMIGLFFGVIVPMLSQYTLYSKEHIPSLTSSLLSTSSPGQYMLIEGYISASNPTRSFDSKYRDLVVYEVWERKDGKLQLTERVMPPFLVDIPNGQVRIVNNDYQFESGLILDPSEIRNINPYIRGFSVGDSILIFGVVVQNSDGLALQASSIDSHTRNTYFEIRRFQRDNTLYLVIPGVLSLAIGLLLLRAAIRAIIRVRSEQHKQL